MIKYLLDFTYSFILACSLLIIWHTLSKEKINFKSSKLYITLIGITIISLFNYFLVNKFIKITIITIVFMFFYRYLFKKSIQQCIITPIYYQLIIMISECIYAIFFILLKFDINQTINSFKINMISNIAIGIISILISRLKLVNIFYNLLLKITDKIKKFQLIIMCIIAMFIANILSMTVYYEIDFVYLLIFNVLMTLSCCVIVFYSFKTQNNYIKVSDKYNVAINSLKDYEEMMSTNRVANHENKNLLLTIRAMILNKEKDIPEYINSIIKEKYNDNEKLLLKVNVIPSGGLRATIYSEILKIKKKKIDYCLNIDKNIKAIDLIELDTNKIIDICKILGVFIDNAIEEVDNLKNKYIGISLYLEDNYLFIEISNNYNKKIELEKLYESGYTTKEKGHGYGLSLVRKIIENNKNFENEISISKEVFTQILKIKINK